MTTNGVERPVGVLTISTKGAQGQRDDTSGDALVELLRAVGYLVQRRAMVADDASAIASALTAWVDQDDLHLIVTTGGTGLSPTDYTPEATASVLHRAAPGIAEAMRVGTLVATPMAMLARGIAGTRGRTLIVNMPGSPKAVRECFAILQPVLEHALAITRGQFGDHARTT